MTRMPRERPRVDSLLLQTLETRMAAEEFYPVEWVVDQLIAEPAQPEVRTSQRLIRIIAECLYGVGRYYEAIEHYKRLNGKTALDQLRLARCLVRGGEYPIRDEIKPARPVEPDIKLIATGLALYCELAKSGVALNDADWLREAENLLLDGYRPAVAAIKASVEQRRQEREQRRNHRNDRRSRAQRTRSSQRRRAS